MPDEIFNNPRLAAIYDAFDGKREDLLPYLAITREYKARSVLDIGCGTGTFACLLNNEGFSVTGFDPSESSLDIARQKLGSQGVNWVLESLPNFKPSLFDMAVMTGNVAQVFLTDDDWNANLIAIHKSLKQDGYLVFETRDPAAKAWQGWTKDRTYKKLNLPEIGKVEGWCDLLSVVDDLVTFRWTYVFEKDGSVLSSDSTLRFRSREETELSLTKSGFIVKEVRDAPDRPSLEFVFIAIKESS